VDGRVEAILDIGLGSVEARQVITIDASDIRPSRNVSRCARVTSLEDSLIEKISAICDISKSTLVRAAIIFTLESLLRGYRDHDEIDASLAAVFTAFDSEVAKKLEECREKVKSLYPVSHG